MCINYAYRSPQQHVNMKKPLRTSIGPLCTTFIRYSIQGVAITFTASTSTPATREQKKTFKTSIDRFPHNIYQGLSNVSRQISWCTTIDGELWSGMLWATTPTPTSSRTTCTPANPFLQGNIFPLFSCKRYWCTGWNLLSNFCKPRFLANYIILARTSLIGAAIYIFIWRQNLPLVMYKSMLSIQLKSLPSLEERCSHHQENSRGDGNSGRGKADLWVESNFK